MAAPIGRDVGIPFKTMGYAVVDFLLIWVGFVVGLAYAFGNNLWIALLVTSILAIRTLHTCGILQEISAERTAHNVIELLRNEFVSLFFMYFFFLLTDRTLSIKTNVK